MHAPERLAIIQRERDEERVHNEIDKDIERQRRQRELECPSSRCRGHKAKRCNESQSPVPVLASRDEHHGSYHKDSEERDVDEVIPLR